MMFLLVLTPPPYFEAECCLFCGRRRMAVARHRMICLVLAIINIGENSKIIMVFTKKGEKVGQECSICILHVLNSLSPDLFAKPIVEM